MRLKLSDFDFKLPQKKIAQYPIMPRDHSKLMVLDRKTKTITHDRFYNLPQYLQSDDVLVFNNSKVFPARLFAHKKATGGAVEIFLLHPVSDSVWEVLLSGKNIHPGLELLCGKKLQVKIIKQKNDGIWEAESSVPRKELMPLLNTIGHVPTPPYIKSKKGEKDYQTIYAKKTGSVAAPTAGFHFTEQTFHDLKTKKIRTEYITLHVGLGTFKPMQTDDITQHTMHAEWAEISETTARHIRNAKKRNNKIITVGTTSTRTLEAFTQRNGILRSGSQWVDIFIYPGYTFRSVDAMITNFHTPKSTLLALVSAFAGRDFIMRAYKEALKNNYRFYSFGDAMLIL